MKANYLRSLLVLLLVFAGPVLAAPIVGTPVSEFGSTNPVGNVRADGTIEFYIPLTERNDVYGVTGGTSSDTCSTYTGTCVGGSLEMYLYFNTGLTGSTLVSLYFGDLDINGVNDPWFLIESLLVYDEFGNVIANISAADLLSSGDRNSQTVSFELSTSGPFHLRLVMSAEFDPDSPGGTYRNTVETLLATAVAVPEPETLALLGMSLLLFAFARRRRRFRWA